MTKDAVNRVMGLPVKVEFTLREAVDIFAFIETAYDPFCENISDSNLEKQGRRASVMSAKSKLKDAMVSATEITS